MQAQTLAGGFASPPIDAAQAFRGVMEAMARPGSLQKVQGAQPPGPLSIAAGTVLLTLCDTDTPVYLAGAADTPEVRQWLAFHAGAPLCGPSHAMFALGTWADLGPLSAYGVGAPDYPDRSATLIVEHPELTATTQTQTLTGPGIRTSAALRLPEVAAFRANRALFPMGLDFIFTSGDQLAALPRTTEVV